MSTPNFYFQRRCVLVTNDDYDEGNYPELGKYFDHNRSYPSNRIEEYEDKFSTIAIVMTSGYYSDACIDIVDDDSLVSELCCLDYQFAKLTRDELFDELYYYFNGNISKRMMLRHLKGLKRNEDGYQSKLANAVDAIFEEVRANEIRKANKVLDELKKEYGYKELICVGVFSNGEAIYNEIR